jgi:hypothetical protein
MTKISAVLLTILAAAAPAGCEKKTVSSGGAAVSLRIGKLDPSEDWGESAPIPFSNEGKIFTISIEPAEGSFHGWARLEARPGEILDLMCNPPGCNAPCPEASAVSRNVRIASARVDLCVNMRLAFGRAHIIARDVGYEPASPLTAACSDGIDNDGDGLADFGSDDGCAYANDNTEQGGSSIVGISPDIRFANPRVENVQGYASASPLEREAVTITYSPNDPTTGRLVVTRISTEGFYFTDIDPLRPGQGYNSLYAYNFNTPWGIRECDVLSMVDGIVGEFLGFTEMNYPAWQVLPVCSDGSDNDGDGLVDMSDPDCAGEDDMSETPLPPDMDPKARVPVPSMSSECPIPDPVELTPAIIADAARMESLESGLVQVQGGVISSNFMSCDYDGDGLVAYEGDEAACMDQCNADLSCTELTQYWQYGQWILNAGGARLFVVSRDACPDFNPMAAAHRGQTLTLLRGILKQIEFIDPPWIVEIRCKDDLVEPGGEIKPITQACVPPRPRGEFYDNN